MLWDIGHREGGGGHGTGEVTVGDQTLNPEWKAESPGRDGGERILLQTHG